MTENIRRCGSWIDSYLEYTEILPSPPLFRKWTAIFYLAAAMERRIWTRLNGADLYPGLYIILVGPPGIGKGQAIHPGERILREVPDLIIGPSDVTTASLIDSLNDAVRRIVRLGDPPYVEFNSLTVISRELGVLIPAWDTSLMNSLTDIYDGLVVDHRRRGKDLHIKILAPQINLLGACTPSWLQNTMPLGAWDQGFISRVILIYSGNRINASPFAEESSPLLPRLRNDLLHDLKSIAAEYGKMNFTVPARDALEAWTRAGYPPEPTHSKLANYNTRRVAHLGKLCMISSISESNNKVIGIEHYREALNWLVEAETYMPDIFKSMTGGGDSSTMEEAWNFIWTIFSKGKKPVPDHLLYNFLLERVPAHNIERVIDTMVKSRMLERIFADNSFQGYRPASREARLSGGYL